MRTWRVKIPAMTRVETGQVWVVDWGGPCRMRVLRTSGGWVTLGELPWPVDPPRDRRVLATSEASLLRSAALDDRQGPIEADEDATEILYARPVVDFTPPR